jgi:hypothetical protein
MKKLITFALVCCMVAATVVIFHEPARADDNPTGVIVGCSLLIVICAILLINNNQPAASQDKHQAAVSPAVPAGQDTNTGASATRPPDTLEKKLNDLKAMHDSGDITDAEYTKLKAKLLLDFK